MSDTNKEYGLVWDREREPEKVVVDCQTNIPVLKEIPEKEINSGSGEDNILIEGDNYHALSVLNYTHKGKVDVIYIDPPYNTGKAKEWKYNDKYIDKEDVYRHSKWLNMMEKRLRLAKNLLKEEGVIFISVDDNELFQLKLLCDKVFGENNFLTNFIWNKKNVVQNDAKFASVNHEYILSYRVSLVKERFELLVRTEEMNARYSNPDNDPRGEWTSVALQAKSGSKNSLYEIEFDNGIKWKPVEGTYPRLTKDSLIKAYYEKRLWFGKSEQNVPRLKKYLSEVKQGAVGNSLLLNSDVGSTQSGKEELKKILKQNIFETPKPKELISRCINLATKSKSAIILDFFAGSGTTGHAVLKLNQEDGGSRRFILCTNNENDICEEVTYPRISKVINGYKKQGRDDSVKGLGGNLHYYQTSLIPAEQSGATDRKRHELTQQAGQMIAMKEHTLVLEEINDWYQIFRNRNNSKKTAIYFREDKSRFNELINKIKTVTTKLYIFSYEREINSSEYMLAGNFELAGIPEPILEIYKQINKLFKK